MARRGRHTAQVHAARVGDQHFEGALHRLGQQRAPFFEPLAQARVQRVVFDQLQSTARIGAPHREQRALRTQIDDGSERRKVVRRVEVVHGRSGPNRMRSVPDVGNSTDFEPPARRGCSTNKRQRPGAASVVR